MKKELLLLGALAALTTSSGAALTSGLIAYYNFEAGGTVGIANQIDGGSTHNGSYGSGTTFGVTPAAGTGAGFAGNAAYAGAEAGSTTNRSDLHVGNALNVAKNDASATAGSGWFNVSTLNTTALGTNFSLSAWFFLSPDADNAGSADVLRDYVFEGGTNFDVSFGTSNAAGSAYASWVGEAASTTSATLTTGEWHNVVHVFSQNGTNTNLTVYIDGAQVGTTISAATSSMNLASLNIGAARNGIRVFDGMLDEVAVWNRALTLEEINNANTGELADSIYQRGFAGLPVPEPSSVLLGSLGMILLFRRRVS